MKRLILTIILAIIGLAIAGCDFTYHHVGHHHGPRRGAIIVTHRRHLPPPPPPRRPHGHHPHRHWRWH